MNLAVIILVYNEERHILRALQSVQDIASQIFVIDSNSTDRTVELAKAQGATVLTVEFVSFAQKFQWAVDNAPITADWILRLDADEVVEPDLAAEIKSKLPTMGADIAGITLKRKYYFFGRWIKHGGRYPLIELRLWRRGQGRIESRLLDERIFVWGGKTVMFEGNFADINLSNLTTFTDKHNKYATQEAVEVLDQRYGFLSRERRADTEVGTRQAAFKRVIKERLYNHLPFWLGPLSYFLYRFFIQLGFLDGKAGTIYHVLQGFWYRFLVNAKVRELETELAGLHDPEEIKCELMRLTGMKL